MRELLKRSAVSLNLALRVKKVFLFRFSCTYLHQQTSNGRYAFRRQRLHCDMPGRRFPKSNFKLESASSAISSSKNWSTGWKPNNKKPEYCRQWVVRVCCDEHYGYKEGQDELGGTERRLVLLVLCGHIHYLQKCYGTVKSRWHGKPKQTQCDKKGLGADRNSEGCH